MTGSGWCEFADRIAIPPTNYQVGADARLAVCLHIMNSSLQSCISWFRSPVSGVSAHFGIGKDGSLKQFVSIRDTAYAQGLSYDQQTGQWFTFRDKVRKNVRPTWSSLLPGMNINRHVISIEHEGKPGEPLTPAMQAAQIRLLKWLYTQIGLTYVVGSSLIGHFNLDNIDRAYCPGPAFNLAEIAMASNAPAEPDYDLAWGTHYPRFVGSGIELAWRDNAAALGPATSDETGDAEGKIWRLFRSGAVSYNPGTRKTVVYVPRGKS